MKINTVTVIGANGTMGANVAALFAAFGNAKVYMVSREIEKSQQAITKATRSVRADSIAKNMIPVDYTSLTDCVSKSDLIFESVAEDLKVKANITKQIAPYIPAHAVVCSGTSGLSITQLAECLTPNMSSRYFGVHFFNPPYSMTLCELIPTKYSDEKLIFELQDYLQSVLFRSVVQTKDSPAFLANRIGFQFINKALQFAERYKDNGGIDYIDSILGPFTGRTMPPIKTADFVGLDIHDAIMSNVRYNTQDYANDSFVTPEYVKKLIQRGQLGRKTRAGLYKTQVNENGSKSTLVYDINSDSYRKDIPYAFPFAESMKQQIKIGNYTEAFHILLNNHSQEAEICIYFLLNYIAYSLLTAADVASNIAAADVAMATGFNWCPPLALLDVMKTATDVPALIRTKLNLDDCIQQKLDLLLSKAPKSTYDYRMYFKNTK